jgi:uncharacterized protein involved in exopolysaccharide biosynthesis
MPDLLDLFFRWWKRILLLVIIAVIIATVTIFFVPKKYLGVTTALPAPAYASDKTAVFGQNLQELYSALGTPDELDNIVGTAHLDTVYIAVAVKLNLQDHYGFGGSDFESRQKSAWLLKKRTRVIKTDYGELQVKTWDTDKSFAAVMANAIMEQLQQIYQDIQTANNEIILSKLSSELENSKGEYQKLHDSISHVDATSATSQLLSARQTSLLQQVQEYEKILNQYKLMVDARPHALIIVEKARPALKVDEPKTAQVIALTAVLSLFFGLLAAVILERRSVRKQ